MKNRLLAVMALCAATSSTMPLWAAEWADPTLQAVDPNLVEDGETGGGEYYIYHPYSGLWMTAGNDYGTTWSVGETGQIVQLKWNIDYILGDPSKTGYVAGHEDVYGWRMVMPKAASNSGFHEIWVSAANRSYVDHNQQGHMLWQFEKQEDGHYRIKVLDEDPTFGKSSGDATLMDGYVGVPQAGETTYIYPCLDPNQAGYEEYDWEGLDWQFVESAAYEVYVAKKSFQKALIDAEAIEGFVIADKYATLYNDPNATAEQIEEAAKELAEDLLNFEYEQATPDNPIDCTSKINNPDFSTGNTNGWTATGSWGFCTRDDANYDGRTISVYPEKWVASTENLANHAIEQNLSGLRNGKYRLTADIHLDKQNDAEILVEGYYLFGKGLGSEVRDTQPIPADPAGAATVAVTHTVEFDVIDSTATIGVRFENVVGNWSGVDNFKLYYLGTANEGGATAILEEYIGTAENKIADVQLNNYQFSKAGEDRYNAYVEYAKTILADTEATDEVIIETVKGLQFEMDTLDIDVNAYETLYNFVNGETTGWAKWDGGLYAEYDMPNYEAYITEIEAAYNDRTFVPAAIDTVAATADSIYMDDVFALAQEATEEFDLTALIVNPNFDNDSKTGWTGMSASVSWGVAELYNGTCNIYQDITGLPEGTYKVSCQGFYRPTFNDVMQAAWGVEGDTTNDILGYIYGNDASAKLKHCYDVVSDEAHSGDVQITGIVDEAYNGKYAPNTRQGCSEIFPTGAYYNEVTCYVGADGKLRIGVKVEGTTLEGNWMPFDDFKLSFVPGDVSGLIATVESNIAAANTMLNSEAVSTTEAKAGLDAAITSASAVLDSGTTDADELTAASDALVAAIEAGQKSIDLVAELTTLVETEAAMFDNSDYDEYMDTAGDQYYELYELLFEGLYDMLDADFESVEQVQGYIDQINSIKVEMIQTALDLGSATKDAPVNVTSLIENPSFTVTGATGAAENSSAGWTVEGTAGGGNVGALNAGVIESWNSDNFDIHQTLKSMPEGWYRLTCKGFYRMSDNNTSLVARRDGVEELNAFLYAKMGEEYTQSLLPSVLDRITEAKTDAGDYVFTGDKDTLAVGGLADYAKYDAICVINNMVGVGTAFKEADYYNAGIYFYVPAGGSDVQIGVRKEKHIVNDWTIWDNFQLTYYGAGAENQPDAIEGVENGKATVLTSTWYTIAGVQIATPKQRGFYIREDVMSDGTTQTLKVFVKD